jgi:hypothetical protein
MQRYGIRCQAEFCTANSASAGFLLAQSIGLNVPTAPASQDRATYTRHLMRCPWAKAAAAGVTAGGAIRKAAAPGRSDRRGRCARRHCSLHVLTAREQHLLTIRTPRTTSSEIAVGRTACLTRCNRLVGQRTSFPGASPSAFTLRETQLGYSTSSISAQTLLSAYLGVPLFVEIGRHSLRVFTNLNDTRVTLRLYQRNQRQIDCPDQVVKPRPIVHEGSLLKFRPQASSGPF